MQTAHRHLLMLRMIPRYPRKIDTATIEQRLLQQDIVIHRRSIQRDLEALSELFPLVADDREKPYGWSWSADAASLELPTLAPTDALLYRMAADYLDRMLPRTVMQYLSPHFDQANKVLDNTDRSAFRTWPDKIRSINRGQPLQPPDIAPEIFDTVSDALLQGKRFQTQYLKRGANEPVSWTINPLGLILHDHLLTLVCTVGDHNELKDVRMLHLHRMQQAEPRQDDSLTPERFSLDAWIASGSLGYLHSTKSIRLKALFEQDATIHLEETPLSHDQQLTPKPDNMVLVEATVADTGQLRWWLLGFGGRIEVLEPVVLREEMQRHAERMLERYTLPPALQAQQGLAFKKATFRKMIQENRSLFRYEPFIDHSDTIRFKGITRQISCSISSTGTITVGAYHRRTLYDIVGEFALSAVQTPDGGYSCILCKETEQIVYKYLDELWQEHCLKPFAAWIHDVLQDDAFLCLFKSGGTTSARICSGSDKMKMMERADFVEALPVKTG